MNENAPAEGVKLDLVNAGEAGSTPQPVPQFQREPNRAERRRAGKGRPSYSFTKDGRFMWNKAKLKGCSGKPKAFITKLSADQHKWVPIEAKKPAKKPRAKKVSV